VATEEKRGVRITQQFRERHNMTYELDCAGARLIVRVFPLGDDEPCSEWLVEARTGNASDDVVASATAPSRAIALDRVAQWWRDNTASRSLGTFDWSAIAQAMASVRAV
jgi:hypothetical protein